MKKSFFISLLCIVIMITPADAEQTVYDGKADGFGRQPVTAEVILEDDKVVGLTVDDSTQSYKLNGVESIQPLVNAIITAGNADGVDAVTGATMTSNAVIAIVKEALAGGTVDYSDLKITYRPGTYVGVGRGRIGDVKVEVAFLKDRINAIRIIESNETAAIAALPQEKIPADILAYQSLGVDAITGATLTSNAILTAVEKAAEQAGANVAALRAVPVEYPKAEVPENMTAQIVVAGGGMAGLVAAVKAADEGADVVIVEKLPFLGGSLAEATGGFATAVTNKSMQKDNLTADLNTTMEWVRSANASANHQPDYDFIEYMMSLSGQTMDYLLQDLGIGATMMDYGRFVRTLTNGGGSGAALKLIEQAKNKGVRIVLNAKVTDILMEDGKAIGIRASTKGGSFVVKANKVIIATGGATHNKKLVTSVNPSLNYMLVDQRPPVGNTGDGWAMLESVGAKQGAGPFLKPNGSPSFAGIFRFTTRTTPSVMAKLIFDANGVRYIREDYGNAQGMSSGIVIEMLRHGSPASYALFDTHNISESLLAQFKSYADNKNIVVYGKNIAEIAQKLSIDEKTLTDTYQRYQYLCETGLDVDYGKAADYLVPYHDDQGLYAAFIQPGAMGTIGGFLTDRQFHVLNKQNEPIENLFAVGEIATSTLFGDYYMGAFSLSYYATAGRIAAETAVAEIKQ